MSDLLLEYRQFIKNVNQAEKENNLFSCIHKNYSSENFHSDILSYLFTFFEARKALIEYLNANGCEIDILKYTDKCECIREEKRVDIKIYSSDKKNVILIENKSNDAMDMPEQIGRYYNETEKDNIKIDGILYLNKFFLKDPDYSSFKNNLEIAKVKKLLVKSNLQEFSDKVLKNIKANSSETSIRAAGISYELILLFNRILAEGKFCSAENINKYQSIFSELNAKEKKIALTLIRNNYLSKLYSMQETNVSWQKIKFFHFEGENIALCINGLFIDKINYCLDVTVSFEKFEVSLVVKKSSGNIQQNESDKVIKKRSKELDAKMNLSGSNNNEHWEYRDNSWKKQKRYVTYIENIFDENHVLTSLKNILNKFIKQMG